MFRVKRHCGTVIRIIVQPDFRLKYFGIEFEYKDSTTKSFKAFNSLLPYNFSVLYVVYQVFVLGLKKI